MTATRDRREAEQIGEGVLVYVVSRLFVDEYGDPAREQVFESTSEDEAAERLAEDRIIERGRWEFTEFRDGELGKVLDAEFLWDQEYERFLHRPGETV